MLIIVTMNIPAFFIVILKRTIDIRGYIVLEIYFASCGAQAGHLPKLCPVSVVLHFPNHGHGLKPRIVRLLGCAVQLLWIPFNSWGAPFNFRDSCPTPGVRCSTFTNLVQLWPRAVQLSRIPFNSGRASFNFCDSCSTLWVRRSTPGARCSTIVDSVKLFGCAV